MLFFPLLASCYCGLSAGWVAVDMMGKVLTVPTFHCDMNTSDFQREWELTKGIDSCQLQDCEAWSFLLTGAFHVIFAICYFQHCSCAHVGLSIARAQDFHAWLSIALDCLQKGPTVERVISTRCGPVGFAHWTLSLIVNLWFVVPTYTTSFYFISFFLILIQFYSYLKANFG